ncbi:hypothetical protein N3K66_001605 [Trichothecium roseum]|uniref:Uncharacterized protein n=1 Tax=Trichothecium roseum TaxID=47278 RepID=A0ACC0VGS0_9HYPO|nr:hypothetical protein N3K66_001605 [Trichothecium roseum]
MRDTARAAGKTLPPSSFLPLVKTLSSIPEQRILSALGSLSDIYCPLARVEVVPGQKEAPYEVADSGYASGAEDDNNDDDDGGYGYGKMDELRADEFERGFAERWLTGFLARAEELPFASEDAREQAADHASSILESFFAGTVEENRLAREELADYARSFFFDVTAVDGRPRIQVDVNDGLAGTDSADPDDVGLQTWGASVVISRLLCAEPERFGLLPDVVGQHPRIVELGAGTGLVSLVLAQLLPKLGVRAAHTTATDYHPAVLSNLASNIAMNTSRHEGDAAVLDSCALDWSAPALDEPPLDAGPADMLFATDVVYEREHALWLRDCSARLLGPRGVFWLSATDRPSGQRQDIVETVEAAFAETGTGVPRDGRGRRLVIRGWEALEKREGVGRGDEGGYRLYRIEWGF